MEYTQQYEYAKALVHNFILKEMALEQNRKVEQEQSMMFQVFTMDPARLSEEDVIRKLTSMFESDENRFMVRLRACAIEIETALGTEFVHQFIENFKNSVIRDGSWKQDEWNGYAEKTEYHRKELDKEIKKNVEKLLNVYPWIWVVSIGFAIYTPSFNYYGLRGYWNNIVDNFGLRGAMGGPYPMHEPRSGSATFGYPPQKPEGKSN